MDILLWIYYVVLHSLRKLMGIVNSNLLPMDVVNEPWIYEEHERNNERLPIEQRNTGKWMLFYDESKINEAWIRCREMYRDNQLDGVVSMKVSTKYDNPRASTSDKVIILYCDDSDNENEIKRIGRNIINLMNYSECPRIYYKTDLQTHQGTRATGCTTNSTYNLYTSEHTRLRRLIV